MNRTPDHAVDARHVAAIAVVALGAIAGALPASTSLAPAGHWLHWLCKPVATVLVIALAWRLERAEAARYRRRVLAGLVFALAGDVLLMLPADLFVPGLVMFLVGHLCFLAAWLVDSRFGTRPAGLAACWLAALGLLAVLWPTLPPALRVPVVIYAAVLATMAGQAVGRAVHHAGTHASGARLAWRAATGAVLFMLSDSLIAIDRFHGPLPLAPLWILGTYYPAIVLIALSIGRGSPPPR